MRTTTAQQVVLLVVQLVLLQLATITSTRESETKYKKQSFSTK